MALPHTIYRLKFDISDVDRGVYEQLALRVAQHPSETSRYLVTRLLALSLHVGDGAEFSGAGLKDAIEMFGPEVDGSVRGLVMALKYRRGSRAVKCPPQIGVPPAERIEVTSLRLVE